MKVSQTKCDGCEKTKPVLSPNRGDNSEFFDWMEIQIYAANLAPDTRTQFDACSIRCLCKVFAELGAKTWRLRPGEPQ